MRTIEPSAKDEPADSLLVACENQWDDACSDVGVAGRRIGRCTVVLRGLTSDNAA
jgi:hypothetical protein